MPELCHRRGGGGGQAGQKVQAKRGSQEEEGREHLSEAEASTELEEAWGEQGGER